MSCKSRIAVARVKAGELTLGASWLGSVDACWEAYVANWIRHAFPLLIDSQKQDYYRGVDSHDVYWVRARIGEHEFFKFGVSLDANKRFRELSVGLPMFEWDLYRFCQTGSRDIATLCETSMLVACHHLLIRDDAEWIYGRVEGPSL